jgi:NADPH:quinone reductase-like Zn-dependent oxidoreductase
MNANNIKPPYFADKKVLITGASSGVGMALAYWYVDIKKELKYFLMTKYLIT